MRTLAIDCATEACSIALFEGGQTIAAEHRILGRGHAEHLVPMIAALPGRGRADRIVVSLGPGSFTGVRIGIAAARALGFAWRAQVRGYPTLALVAAMALASRAADGVTVCMSGGHGEWFVQDFDADGLPLDALASLAPDRAVQRPCRALIAGSQGPALAERIGRTGDGLALLPEAAHVALLDPALLSEAIAPIYGRSPDARAPG